MLDRLAAVGGRQRRLGRARPADRPDPGPDASSGRPCRPTSPRSSGARLRSTRTIAGASASVMADALEGTLAPRWRRGCGHGSAAAAGAAGAAAAGAGPGDPTADDRGHWHQPARSRGGRRGRRCDRLRDGATEPGRHPLQPGRVRRHELGDLGQRRDARLHPRPRRAPPPPPEEESTSPLVWIAGIVAVAPPRARRVLRLPARVGRPDRGRAGHGPAARRPHLHAGQHPGRRHSG